MKFLPRQSDYDGLAHAWRGDVVAGLTVGIVALPLALAFGITTGLGAQAGLVTAIVAGVVAAALGGSNVQVSGPTAAMTVVLVPIVARHGREAVFVVGLVAGVVVTVAAVARLGRAVRFIPWPVVEGFTIGIAVIIILQQVPAAFGVRKPEGENTAVVAIRAGLRAIDDGNRAALLLVVVVAAVMVVSPRLHRSLPVSLLAVVVATVICEAADMHVARIGTLPGSLPLPALPDLSLGASRTCSAPPSLWPRSRRSKACCRPRSLTAWLTRRGTTPTGSCSVKDWQTSSRRCSEAFRRRAPSLARR